MHHLPHQLIARMYPSRSEGLQEHYQGRRVLQLIPAEGWKAVCVTHSHPTIKDVEGPLWRELLYERQLIAWALVEAVEDGEIYNDVCPVYLDDFPPTTFVDYDGEALGLLDPGESVSDWEKSWREALLHRAKKKQAQLERLRRERE